MARRSYLKRIAEPLAIGEPVLFVVPRAPAGDARPAGGTASGTVPARATAVRTAPPPGAFVPVSLSHPAGSSARPQAGARQAVATPAASGPAAVTDALRPRPEADARPSLFDPAPPRFAAEQTAASALAATRVPLVPFGSSQEQSTAPASVVDHSEPGGRETGTTFQALDRPAPEPPSIRLQDQVMPAQPQPATTAAPNHPGASRLHIGTIEVRVPAPPPAPVPAQTPPAGSPVRATTPLSRAYGWRFGLAQG
jgi:hypothetical protein